MSCLVGADLRVRPGFSYRLFDIPSVGAYKEPKLSRWAVSPNFKKGVKIIMIIDQSIKDEVKKQAEQAAPTEDCPRCGIVGMTAGKVVTKRNFSKAVIPKGQEKPTKIDVERPFDCLVQMICPRCRYGHPWAPGLEC